MNSFEFVELTGRLEPGGPPLDRHPDVVVFSSLSRGGSETAAGKRFSLKYVGSGVEVYRYGGKTYPVAAGQFLAVPPDTPGEVEIAHHSEGGASGICLSLRCLAGRAFEPEAPILFAAGCSTLGRMLAASHRQMSLEADLRRLAASSLVTEAGRGFELLMEEALGHYSSLSASRPSTRYDLLRKLNLARSYLHSVDDRAVGLTELSGAAGISQFHLLRNFRSCFGVPPSTYHRQIRLKAAKVAVDGGTMTCGEAAHRFGFADGASFSHAFKRAFGTSPKDRLPS